MKSVGVDRGRLARCGGGFELAIPHFDGQVPGFVLAFSMRGPRRCAGQDDERERQGHDHGAERRRLEMIDLRSPRRCGIGLRTLTVPLFADCLKADIPLGTGGVPGWSSGFSRSDDLGAWSSWSSVAPSWGLTRSTGGSLGSFRGFSRSACGVTGSGTVGVSVDSAGSAVEGFPPSGTATPDLRI